MILKPQALIIVSAVISLAIPIAIAMLLRTQIQAGFGDFKFLYVSGEIVRSGQGSNLYKPGILLGITNAHGPHEALVLAPIASLPFAQAVWLWWSANLLLSYACLYLLLPITPNLSARLELALLSLGIFVPLLMAEVVGQDTIVTLFLFTLCLRSLAAGRLWIAGSALALAMYKPNLVLPAVAMLTLTTSGWFSIIAGFLCTCTLLVFISSIVIGPNAVLAYPHAMLSFAGSKSDSYVPDMPNIRGLVSWILEPHVSRVSISLIVASVTLFTIFISAWLVRRTRQKGNEGSQQLGFALVVVASLLVGYHDYAYDLTLLLLPLALIWDWSAIVGNQRLSRTLLRNSAPAMVCLSFLILLKSQIYSGLVVLLFILTCRELYLSHENGAEFGGLDTAT